MFDRRNYFVPFEVSQIFDCSLSSVYNLMHRGFLPYTKIGGRYYLLKSDILNIFNCKSFVAPCEVSQVLGCSVSSVYNFIHRGDLYSVKIGGRYYIPSNHVSDILENPVFEKWCV